MSRVDTSEWFGGIEELFLFEYQFDGFSSPI
jgi:hypothetical protein